MNPLAKFFKDAITHWKTSSAGLAAGLLVVANSYQQGMTWKQWAIAGALAFLGLSAPDSSKVAKPLALLLLPGLAMAQNAPAVQPLFSVSTQAVGVRIGGQTVVGTDEIGNFNLTPNLQLRSENILAPANNLQAYLGGVSYYAPFLSKPFEKTNLSSVKPYLTGALGVVRNVPAVGATRQHYAALLGAGFDWSINGTLSVGPRVSYLNAPGFGPGPHGALVSANLTLILGKK